MIRYRQKMCHYVQDDENIQKKIESKKFRKKHLDFVL